MQSLMKRYAQERLLYRLSVSEFSKDFCVKGGVMLAAFNNGQLLRPSEDIDFNGFVKDGNITMVAEMIKKMVQDCEIEDGVEFNIDAMKIEKDRDGKIPGGKVTLVCNIGTARVEVRVDVGFGNAITPDAKKMIMPTLLGDNIPQPEVLVSPLETMISEKLHATFRYGLHNTRLKDFFDLWLTLKTNDFDGQTICDAIVNTFDCHDDPLPTGSMPGLSDEFAEDNVSAWKAFLKKIEYKDRIDLQTVIEEVRAFAEPVMRAAASDKSFSLDWRSPQGWAEPAMALAI
jgi:predicted nucleotidyltransferase component of viral defense system